MSLARKVAITVAAACVVAGITAVVVKVIEARPWR